MDLLGLMQFRESARLVLKIGRAEEDLLRYLAESAHRYPSACLKQLQATENPLLPQEGPHRVHLLNETFPGAHWDLLEDHCLLAALQGCWSSCFMPPFGHQVGGNENLRPTLSPILVD